MIRFRHLLAAVLLFAALPAAQAADDGLYDKPIDPNSSFVRVLTPGATIAVVDGKTMQNLANGLSPYVNVQPGEIAVSAGEASASVTAEPGGYYTLGWAADGSSLVFKDVSPTDPSKAQVYVYNLSDKPMINLFVPAAKVDAVKDVPKDGSVAVALKAPLTLDMEVRSGSDTLATLSGVELKRKGGVTIVLTGDSSAYVATAAENSFLSAGAGG